MNTDDMGEANSTHLSINQNMPLLDEEHMKKFIISTHQHRNSSKIKKGKFKTHVKIQDTDQPFLNSYADIY